jgi:hypothetical protein
VEWSQNRQVVFEQVLWLAPVRFALVKKLLPVLNTESGALRVHKKAKLLLNKYFVAVSA